MIKSVPLALLLSLLFFPALSRAEQKPKIMWKVYAKYALTNTNLGFYSSWTKWITEEGLPSSERVPIATGELIPSTTVEAPRDDIRFQTGIFSFEFDVYCSFRNRTIIQSSKGWMEGRAAFLGT